MALSEETLAQFPAALRGMVSRSMVNLFRVDGLIQIYDQQKQGATSTPHFEPADILRACVVLLHATLEDILRSAALALMPRTAGPDQWDAISTGESRQPEKIRLGWLLKFRGKTVEEVLAQRAARHFEQVSFSKIEQLESHLRSIGIRTGPFGKYFEDLSALIERRHKIVHNADFESQDLSQQPSPLDPNLVKRWS